MKNTYFVFILLISAFSNLSCQEKGSSPPLPFESISINSNDKIDLTDDFTIIKEREPVPFGTGLQPTSRALESAYKVFENYNFKGIKKEDVQKLLGIPALIDNETKEMFFKDDDVLMYDFCRGTASGFVIYFIFRSNLVSDVLMSKVTM